MSIPNIEFLDKLWVFLGSAIIILSGLFIYNRYKEFDNYQNEFRQIHLRYIKALEKATGESVSTQAELEEYNKKAKAIIEKMKSSPGDISLLKKEYDSLKTVYDLSTRDLYIKREASSRHRDSLSIIYEEKKENFQSFSENYISEYDTAYKAIVVGAVILLIGIFSWSEKEKFEKRMLIRQNLEKPTFSEHCQSCGKSFNSVVVPGKEIDGQKNYHFCRNCYVNGLYTEPNLTLEELKNRTRTELSNNSISSSKISKILRFLETLDRWKRSYYK